MVRELRDPFMYKNRLRYKAPDKRFDRDCLQMETLQQIVKGFKNS
jgi:hypothetical protein